MPFTKVVKGGREGRREEGEKEKEKRLHKMQLCKE